MTPKELRILKIQAHEKDTRAILHRDFSASRMNTTKWAEPVHCLSGLPVRYRLKFVDVEDKEFEVGGFWHRTGDWFDTVSLGIFTSNSIEWLDINPLEKTRDQFCNPKVVSHSDEIEKRLASISVPHHWEGDFIRIIGHVRKSGDSSV